MSGIPRWLIWTGVVLLVVSWIPLALIARARQQPSPKPRIHLVPDMDNQISYKAQEPNPMFADGRAMRPRVEGTVSRDDVVERGAVVTGRSAGAPVDSIPIPVTLRTVQRGQRQYDVFCTPCHGASGYGDGVVAKRADALQEGTWTPPSSLHTDVVRGRSDGHLYNSITNGIRNMPPYGPQLSVEDRWAVVAYVRALQRSQNTDVVDVPDTVRGTLR